MAMSLITCLRLPIIEWAHPVVVYRTPARLSTSQPSHVWDRSRLWKGQPSEGHQRSPPQSSLSLRPYVRDQWGNRVKIAQRWEGEYEGFRYTYTHTTLHIHTYIHYTYYTTHTLHLHYVRDQWGNRVKIAQRWEGKYGGFRYTYTHTTLHTHTYIHYTYYTTHTLHLHYVRDQWGNRVKIAQRWEGKYGGFRYSNYTYTHLLHYTHIHYTYYTTHTLHILHYTYTTHTLHTHTHTYYTTHTYTTHTTLHIHYTYTLHSSLI